MSEFAVLNLEGKENGKIDWPEDVFGKRANTAVIYQAIVKYRASLRQGNASTKERADVSGGGKKPFRQKGTGRARAGSSRSPLWKGGGVTFGPHPRDFSYTLPTKIKRAALRESINVKYQDKNLICINDIKESFNKTKEFVKVIDGLNLKGKTLAVLDGSDPSVERASRNIAFFSLMRAQDINAFDVLRYKNLLITETAFKRLLDRIKK